MDAVTLFRIAARRASGYAGYILFTLIMFGLFLGLFSFKHSGAASLASGLRRLAPVTLEQPELVLLPPGLDMASLTLHPQSNVLPALTVTAPRARLGLAGLFPPRCSISVEGSMGKGALRLDVESSALTAIVPRLVTLRLDGVDPIEAGIVLPLVSMERGRLYGQLQADLTAGSRAGSGTAELRLENAKLDLPFPDPALRYMDGVSGFARLGWDKDQLNISEVSLRNDILSLEGGGLIRLNFTSPAASGLDIRLSLRKNPESPPLPELYPAIARLNKGEVVIIQVSGSPAQPAVSAQR